MYGVIATSMLTWVGGEGNPLTADLSRIEIILLVWIYASISEEILFRGVVQTIIAKKTKRVIKVLNRSISVSVFVAAIIFAMDHLGPMLLIGASTARIIIIVLFVFTVGITAGHYREKTGSLLPAVIIHMFSNIGGALPVIMLSLID
ncbi:MAG: CPBP family intramembrane metalloprotease [Candidatus Delongbacteria bacterium]|nr:CPBP family intramembrane metalloprotease [Candidatus Delongbacteria bacterium]